MTTKQSRENYQTTRDPQLNYILQRIADRLDALEGIRSVQDAGIVTISDGNVSTTPSNTTEWDAAYDHVSASGDSHSSVVLNNAHRTGSGSDHSAVALNTSHSTGDGSDHSAVALKTNVLQLDNTTAFTPDEDYEPATKKYVDDLAPDISESETLALILALK